MGRCENSRTVLALLAILFPQLLVSGCSIVRPVGRFQDGGQDPAQVWTMHRSYLLEVNKSGKWNQTDFEKAIFFFEDLTGIPSQLDASSLVGLILDPERLKVALNKWDQWYLENGKRIYWDPVGKHYSVK